MRKNRIAQIYSPPLMGGDKGEGDHDHPLPYPPPSRGRKLSLILILLLLAIPCTALSATIEKIVAVVDGKVITMYDLDQAMKEIGPKIQKEQNVSGADLRAMVLNDIINNKILESAIEKSKIKVEPHEIDTYIDRVLRSSRITLKQFEEQLAQKGMTLDKYKEDIRKQILNNKFLGERIGRKINTTERELKDYFDQHMDDFTTAGSVQIAQISIPFTEKMTDADLDKIEEMAKSIAKDAQTTGNFEELAKKYNDKPYRVLGGSLGVVGVKDLQPAIANMVMQLKVGDVSPPIVTSSGMHIVKVLDRAKTSAKDFGSVRDQVQNALFDAKLGDALKAYIKELRKTTNVEIKGLGLN